MADLVWTDVVAIAPELADPAIPTAAQTVILTYVNDNVKVENFDGEDGNTTLAVRSYLAAHMATAGTLQGASGAAGPVSSEKAGDLARSYATSVVTSVFGSTSYGNMFVMLTNNSRSRMMTS